MRKYFSGVSYFFPVKEGLKVCRERGPFFSPLEWFAQKTKSDSFVKKSLFVFWPSLKNMTGSYCKNGPKTHYHLKMAFLVLDRKQEVIFFKKNLIFSLTAKSKKCHFLDDNEFLAHFWQYDPVTFFRLRQKTKWFFSQKNHFLFSEQTILMGRKGGDSNNPKHFWHNLLLRPDLGDFKTWNFWTS